MERSSTVLELPILSAPRCTLSDVLFQNEKYADQLGSSTIVSDYGAP